LVAPQPTARIQAAASPSLASAAPHHKIVIADKFYLLVT
jgi:hypothetical protein